MTGETISHYRITAQLGRGGMGIVYKAEDTKLDRTVAIKVLPPAALVSDDDRARFYREAKAAAQLTHPNIAAVYEIDEAVPSGAPHGSQPSPFIAMEYIDGKTLAEHVAKGPLKLKDAVRIASEVAEALKAAHGKNIVHRDVKSGNVMLDADGRAKVLDFGLAKTTHSTMLTQMGSTLGTVAYMSPEQARGEDVDYRSDLWSLGILIYEMVAGRLPYGGDYEQAVVYAILNEAPEPLTAIRSGVPMGLEWIVSKCLAKDPADRYQSASDLIVDLRNVDVKSSSVSHMSKVSTAHLSAVAGTAPMTDPVVASRGRKWLAAWPVAVVALVAGLAAGYGLFAGSGAGAADAPLLRVEVPLPSMRYVRFPTLSPTREYLAVVGSDTLDRTGIFLRDMSSGELRHVEGTGNAGAREIKFSPDGTRLAFTADANGGVFTVVLPSGLPEQQTDLGRLIYWEDNETILYLDDSPGGQTYRKQLGQSEPEIVQLEDPTLTPELVDIIKTGIHGSSLAFGHQFARTGTGYAGVSKIFSADLSSGRVEILESEVMNPEYVAGGFLTYQMRGDEGLLVVRRIDERTGQFIGTPRDVLPDGESTVWGQYAVTDQGDLVYQSWDALPGTATNRLLTIDLANRTIRPVELVMSGGRVPLLPQFSPVNDDIAFGLSVDGDQSLIAVFDQELGSHFLKTYEGNRVLPFWSPDGRYLYYHVIENGTPSLVRTRVDESDTEELVLENFAASEFSPDGRFLLGVRNLTEGSTELVLLDMRSGNAARIDSSRSYFDGSFSPDGRFVVYDTQAPLGRTLVVRSVTGQGRYEIPNLAARTPRWSPDGRYIYFISGGIRRVPVRTRPGFQVVGNPELVASTSGADTFDLNRDGTKIVVSARDAQFRMSYQSPSVVWLQNWSAHLQREMGR